MCFATDGITYTRAHIYVYDSIGGRRVYTNITYMYVYGIYVCAYSLCAQQCPLKRRRPTENAHAGKSSSSYSHRTCCAYTMLTANIIYCTRAFTYYYIIIFAFIISTNRDRCGRFQITRGAIIAPDITSVHGSCAPSRRISLFVIIIIVACSPSLLRSPCLCVCAYSVFARCGRAVALSRNSRPGRT